MHAPSRDRADGRAVKIRGKFAARDAESPTAPRRPPHEVLGTFGGGSPYGSTRYKTRRLCPFEDGLVTVARLRRQRNHEALDLGWIVHQGWEAYYGQIKAYQDTYDGIPSKKSARDEFFWGALPEAEQAALDVIDTFKGEENYRATWEDAKRIMTHYIDRYRRQDRWHVLAVEETLIYEEELPEPVVLYNADGSEAVRQTHFRYSARLDGVVVEYTPGRSFGTKIVECKTAKIISEDLLHGYQQDMQILGQQWLFERCVDLDVYPKFRGICVNIASKHKTPQFERVECLGSPYHLQAFEDSTRRWALANRFLAELDYPKALGSCAGALRGYSRCAYYDLCHGHPERTISDWASLPPPDGFYREMQPEESSE